MADRFVTKTAITQAVADRQTDVLDKLGIPWRDDCPHIDCPYPAHGGKNDWRWDAKKSRAFCTCTKSDSVFDVVMKVKGIDFEEAKLYIAELIGRGDLIREKNGAGRQATDAASLLSASAERRDDTLPIAYLAHRLGIDVAAVPIPRTPIVGLKALGYYDPPPQGSKTKPKCVGEFPCAVFGTVAADGRTHAHRIYLAPSGAGKADLGVGPAGRPRDPKKSAKIIGDDNTAGRSALWGDPAVAPHIVLVEGVETATAIALALVAEIMAGEIAVAAAITAGGIEAFELYSTTTRITVAADRDEGEKNGRSGSRRGGRAARTFGTRHCEQISISIALPGASGESVDWLDILLRDGIDAVRAGIFAAIPFVPTKAELDAAAQNQSRAAELEEITATYPLPAMDTLVLRYEHTAAGCVKIHKVTESKGEHVLVPVMTPFGVSARLRYIDQANAYGLRCVVRDMNGKPRAIDFDRAALPRLAASDIRSMLFAAGLRTEVNGEMIAVQMLKAADPAREIVAVRRPGWHRITGCSDPIYITPKGEVIGAPEGFDLELSMAVRIAPNVAEAGTLAGWRNASATAASVKKCPHWTLGILAGFAGTIVELAGLETCGVNLSGLSSSGKTLAQRLAASAWSSPNIRQPGLFQSARTTDNAVEGLAQRSSGTVLVLDETAHVDGKTLGKMIYTIAGGTGKRRMTSDAGLRDSSAWITFVILSCECSLAEKVRGDGGEWLAGMAVRIVDVDVTDIDRNVDAATLRIINEIEHHHGHAGPAFVRGLIEQGLHREGPALRDCILQTAKELAGGDGTDSATLRAATPLSVLLIAGGLAQRFGLLPPEIAIEDAVKWAWGRFSQSSDAAVLDPEDHVVANLQTWIAERWAVTIKNVDSEGATNNREAVAWFDDAAIYIPKNRIREASGNALKESEIGAILARRELLASKPEADRFYVRWVPKVGRVGAYALRREKFGRAQPILKVHPGGRDD
jgi:phage/plasmid primase-like uncharacterized protein